MKKILLFFIGLLLTIDTFANVNFIDINKISNDSKYVAAFNIIKDNQQYYNHWTTKWSYDKPKEELIKMLKDNYATFSAIETKNTELYLLLGDLSQYLYNLNDSLSYDLAISNYSDAIKSNPKDFRAYWFLANHFALSNVPTKAFDNFLNAQALLPTEQPADFWNDYASAMAFANMPSHCIFAMDKVKSITGISGSFETQLGPTIHKRIVDIDKDKSYKKEDIWVASKDVKAVFTSRPLGMKIQIDPTWNLSVYDYKNRNCAFIITPSALKNKKGKEINYTVALIMKVANDGEKLDDYINNLVSKYPDKNKIPFSDKYNKMIAYEIKDKTVYQDIGGGHLYMIGIERNAPEYPGLLFEKPVELPEGNKNQITYYKALDSKGRFAGKIFYAIMLDSCEDIHEQSFAIFKNLFDNQITIE